MAKIKSNANVQILPCYDYQRRTCLQVTRSETEVQFIPLDVAHGLRVQKSSTTAFDQRYKPMVGYPVVQACQLYLRYSQDIGATKEVIKYLDMIINVKSEEADKAINKVSAKQEKEMKKVKKVEAPKVVESVVKRGRKAAPPSETVTADAPRPWNKKEQIQIDKAKLPTEGKRKSAAQMFKDLIMESELTDDQIFLAVQAEFELDQSKRSYVSWYRNWLKVKGYNPPAPM